MKLHQKITSVSLLVVSVYSTGYIGFHLGKLDERSAQSMRQDIIDRKMVEAHSQPAPRPIQAAAEKPNTKILRPVDLAKAKGVPEKVASAQGDYTLVSVVEGAEINQQLTENLQLVTAQRQQLANLAAQFDQSPANATQQRELIAGQINEVKMSLTRNLRVMAQEYSYSLNNVYLRIPHQVALLSMVKVDGQVKMSEVHSLDSAEEYEKFQKMNDTYQRLKLEENKVQQVEKETEAGSEGKVAKFTPSKQLLEQQEKMIRLYQFDPEQQYFLKFEKTAFYARPVRS